jgi:hypothetical protein
MIYGIGCERCGDYYVTGTAESAIGAYPTPERALISGVTRERSEQRNPVTVILGGDESATADAIGASINQILDLAPRSIPDRIDRALQHFARRTRYFGDPVEVDASPDYPLVFAENPQAFAATLRHMVESGLLNQLTAADDGSRSYALTVKGWERVGELQHLRPESRQTFVAMWFDTQMDEAYKKGIEPAIRDARYDPKRVDLAQFNGKIDDYIVAEIRRSRFLVVDVTGHRPAVYFEAGFAMGLGIPVIFTCHEDHLEGCCFDTRQHNHIAWEAPEDLRVKLRNRIEATIG